MSDTTMKQRLLLAEVKSMIILANDRLGANSPWIDFPTDECNFDELSSARKLLHEILYTPPLRS